MLELYYLEEADSICSNRVLMTLSEKNITEWTPRKLVLLNRDQFKEDYLKLNPKAQVPTLVHNGIPIRESSIICDYIDNHLDEKISEISAASGVVLDSSPKKEFNENFIKAKSLLDLYK